MVLSEASWRFLGGRNTYIRALRNKDGQKKSPKRRKIINEKTHTEENKQGSDPHAESNNEQKKRKTKPINIIPSPSGEPDGPSNAREVAQAKPGGSHRPIDHAELSPYLT